MITSRLVSRQSAFALLLAGASFLVPSQAQATFQFTTSNFTNNTISSPYANLTITGNTSLGQVTFSIDVNGNPAKFSDFGFNFNHTNLLSTDISLVSGSVTGTGGDFSGWGLVNGGQMDAQGDYDKEFRASNNGAGNRLTSLSFTIQLAAGKFSFATESNFTILNGALRYFCLEYQPDVAPTGFVSVTDLGGGGGGNEVPAPPSVVLAAIGGFGWISSAFVRGRRKLFPTV